VDPYRKFRSYQSPVKRKTTSGKKKNKSFREDPEEPYKLMYSPKRRTYVKVPIVESDDNDSEEEREIERMKRLAYEEEMRKLRKPKVVDHRRVEITVDVNLKDKGK